ncbi:MAG: decaprenyl-phosphate phosphoribosyltransferase [Melioribacteraceae bacterium]
MKLSILPSLLRIEQYIKNIFVLAPLFFSKEFVKLDQVFYSMAAVLIFSITASSIYIFNDIRDVEEDRKHPTKQFRPIASNKISVKNAVIVMSILMFTGLLSSYLISLNFFLILITYLILNVFYSFGLKHISIVDIVIVSIGFVLRVFAGAVVINVVVTSWIILITFMLSLFLAFAKRRDDILLANEGNKTRKNIHGYSLTFVDSSMVLMAGVVIVSYILYTVSPEIEARYNSQYIYLTVLFVILGILRYMQITYIENKSGNPTEMAFKDRFLQITILCWLASFGLILYVF